MLNFLFFTNDPALQKEVQKALSGRPYGLVMATNYQDALSMLGHVFISMVVMDFNMSRVKCASLLDHIKEHYPDIPVVALSSVALDPKELSPNISASYVGTPFVSNDLRQIIEAEIKNLISGGTIGNVSPPSFAQLLEMEAKTCILRVFEKDTRTGGLLAFKAGTLVDARMGGFTGLDAACRILAWDEADIYIQNRAYPDGDRIGMKLKSIIVQSVHMKDEGRPAVQPPPQSPAAHHSRARQPQHFPQALKQFLDKHLDNTGTVVDVQYDANAQDRLQGSMQLGPLFDLGRLRLICEDDGSETRLLVAGPAPTVVRLSAQSPLEKITLLITRFLEMI